MLKALKMSARTRAGTDILLYYVNQSSSEFWFSCCISLPVRSDSSTEGRERRCTSASSMDDNRPSPVVSHR